MRSIHCRKSWICAPKHHYCCYYCYLLLLLPLLLLPLLLLLLLLVLLPLLPQFLLMLLLQQENAATHFDLFDQSATKQLRLWSVSCRMSCVPFRLENQVQVATSTQH